MDASFTRDDRKIVEPQVYQGDTACNRLYPPHANPYIVAGMSVANNMVKYVLKPINPKDHGVAFSAADFAALPSIFLDGVCDPTKNSLEQRPLMGTWISFGPA